MVRRGVCLAALACLALAYGAAAAEDTGDFRVAAEPTPVATPTAKVRSMVMTPGGVEPTAKASTRAVRKRKPRKSKKPVLKSSKKTSKTSTKVKSR